jgi:hypothetical protein
MSILDKAAILAAQDLPTQTVTVPEWGGDVTVRSMTGADRDQYEQALLAQRGPDGKTNMMNVRARLAAFCMVDADGKRLFADEDIAALGSKSAAALDRVFAAASKLNGIGQKDVEALGEPSAAAGAASTSSLPSDSGNP